ncbi:hypothetical protein TrVE_jg5310 [Triparma verrucosa]|uniref:WW domain-containing protein n=1 Tax=Triparma verrucosa TaxID=1606542 RepID=A0A9W7BEY1_9STRA|nr:hypothetical protein TrVE_jg5310 [Triparma verrucosa]
MDQVSTPNGPDTPISLLLSPAPSSASTLPLNSSINGATGVAVDVSPPITSRLHQKNTPSTLDSVIKHRRSELRRLQKIRAAKDEQTGGVHALIARARASLTPGGSRSISSNTSQYNNNNNAVRTPYSARSQNRFRKNVLFASPVSVPHSVPSANESENISPLNDPSPLSNSNKYERFASKWGTLDGSTGGPGFPGSHSKRRVRTDEGDNDSQESPPHSSLSPLTPSNNGAVAYDPTTHRLVRQLQGEQEGHAAALLRIKELEERVLKSMEVERKVEENLSRVKLLEEELAVERQRKMASEFAMEQRQPELATPPKPIIQQEHTPNAASLRKIKDLERQLLKSGEKSASAVNKVRALEQQLEDERLRKIKELEAEEKLNEEELRIASELAGKVEALEEQLERERLEREQTARLLKERDAAAEQERREHEAQLERERLEREEAARLLKEREAAAEQERKEHEARLAREQIEKQDAERAYQIKLEEERQRVAEEQRRAREEAANEFELKMQKERQSIEFKDAEALETIRALEEQLERERIEKEEAAKAFESVLSSPPPPDNEALKRIQALEEQLERERMEAAAALEISRKSAPPLADLEAHEKIKFLEQQLELEKQKPQPEPTASEPTENKAQLSILCYLVASYSRRAQVRWAFQMLKRPDSPSSEVSSLQHSNKPTPSHSPNPSSPPSPIQTPHPSSTSLVSLNSSFNELVTNSASGFSLPAMLQLDQKGPTPLKPKARYSMSPTSPSTNFDTLKDYYESASPSVFATFSSELAKYTVRVCGKDGGKGDLFALSKTSDEDYATSFDPRDPTTIQIHANVFADRSFFVLALSTLVDGDGKRYELPTESCVLYIDEDGNEKEYGVNELAEECLSTRASYCTSLIAAATAIQAATPRKLIKALANNKNKDRATVERVIEEVVGESGSFEAGLDEDDDEEDGNERGEEQEVQEQEQEEEEEKEEVIANEDSRHRFESGAPFGNGTEGGETEEEEEEEEYAEESESEEEGEEELPSIIVEESEAISSQSPLRVIEDDVEEDEDNFVQEEHLHQVHQFEEEGEEEEEEEEEEEKEDQQVEIEIVEEKSNDSFDDDDSGEDNDDNNDEGEEEESEEHLPEATETETETKTETTQTAVAPPVSVPLPEGMPPLPEGWVALQTADGQYYFCCEATGESTWQHPGMEALAPVPPQDIWCMFVDDSGKKYYYNPARNLNQWELPQDVTQYVDTTDGDKLKEVEKVIVEQHPDNLVGVDNDGVNTSVNLGDKSPPRLMSELSNSPTSSQQPHLAPHPSTSPKGTHEYGTGDLKDVNLVKEIQPTHSFKVETEQLTPPPPLKGGGGLGFTGFVRRVLTTSTVSAAITVGAAVYAADPDAIMALKNEYDVYHQAY